MDTSGNPVETAPTIVPFQGIRDTFRANFALARGIPLTDVRILVINGLCALAPAQDDKLFIMNKWYQVRMIVEIDPADATTILAGFECAAP